MEHKEHECHCEWCEAHKLYRATNNPYYLLALVIGDAISVWENASESVRKKDFRNLPSYRDSLDHLDLVIEEVKRFKCEFFTSKYILIEALISAEHLLKKVYGILDECEEIAKGEKNEQ